MALHTKGFQDRFVPLVADGRKRQTIRQRKIGKPAPELGDVIWCVGANMSQSLGKWAITEVLPITIDLVKGQVVLRDTYRLAGADLEHFAQLDGFTCAADMLQWFREQYAGLQVFEGDVIGWPERSEVLA